MTTVLGEPAARPGRILLVDDEDALRRVASRALENVGHEVVEAADGEAALREIDRAAFDAVLTDINMPRLNGIQLLRAVRARDLDVPVVIMTGLPTTATAMSAIELGALAYLDKPLDLAHLREQMQRAVALGRLARAKREALVVVSGAAAGAGDRAGLEATFARTMATLWPAFQPIVERDGSLYAYEALLRSREPELPHPGAVLDAAEKLDRVLDVGRRMRALSAEAMANASSCLLFVNLHPRDLLDDELLSADAPLTRIAKRVVLEITERAGLDAIGDLKTRTSALRERGFRLAIDDLGAGYAGLNSFALLEPEVVKLDMSLVRDVDKNATKQKLVRTMSSLCSDLGMRVVAEGVETKEELACVIELGCDLVQGYLIAKPGPAFPSFTWPGR